MSNIFLTVTDIGNLPVVVSAGDCLQCNLVKEINPLIVDLNDRIACLKAGCLGGRIFNHFADFGRIFAAERNNDHRQYESE